jgi:hypothetical protein
LERLAKLESNPSVDLGAADLTSLVFADHFPPGSSDGICPVLTPDNLAQRALYPPGLLCGAPPRAAIFPKTSGMERATVAPLKTSGPVRSKAALYCLNLVSRARDPLKVDDAIMARPPAPWCRQAGGATAWPEPPGSAALCRCRPAHRVVWAL